MSNPIMNTYGSPSVSFVKGEGAWLTDDNGNRYLDALSGIAVVALGHAHPGVTETISRQASTLVHTSNLYGIPNQRKLAETLTSIAGMDNAFFANSGAEANEAAIKITRLYGRNKGIANPALIVMDGSFHGRTLATLTATGSRKVHAGFEPLVEGFVRAPFDDVESVKAIAANNPNIAGILVEPVLGEGGVHIPADNYLAELRAICDQNDWLLVLDEVQTGNGRTGTYFAYQQTDVLPDVITTAKGLGNGMPIGVCMARGKAAEVFGPGNHGSTFGGNPLATAVAQTVVDTIVNDKLAERAGELGERMRDRLRGRLEGVNCVKEIRGKGLMIGVELDAPCPDFVAKAQEKGVLLNVTADSVIRLLPPLVLSDAEADQICDVVADLVEAI